MRPDRRSDWESRRKGMKPHGRLKHLTLLVIVATLVGGVGPWGAGRSGLAAATPPPADPEAALNELRAGNLRFTASRRTRSTDTRHDADRRHRTAKGQHPFATVLCCSDSRVCPEFIFDQPAGS